MDQENTQLTALTAERTWDDGGVAVLTASAELPQLPAQARRARRFNRYYRRVLRAFFLYCEQELLPAAKADCAAALARSAPWEPPHAALRCVVTLRRGELLSLYTEVRQTAPRLILRRAETWDLSAMLPVPLAEWFPPHTRCRKLLLRRARDESLARMERGEAAYRPDYRIALRRALNTRSYYLTPDALHFFYPMYALGGAHEGIPDFRVPYDAASGPFPPPEA